MLAWTLPAAASGQGPERIKRDELNRSEQAAHRALERAKSALDARGVRERGELTAALHDLARRAPALDSGDLREAGSVLARPTDGAADSFGDGYSAPAARHCTANFCVHYVTTTADAPNPADGDGDAVPDFVEQVAAELEYARAYEVGTLGWRAPLPDGARGGDARTDAYIKDLGGRGAYGYAATDIAQPGAQRFGYLVLDDDYDGSFDPLRVTIAHEYNHLLQYAYDSEQDFWMFEATAVWVEKRAHPSIQDWLAYLPAWAGLPQVPLARWNYASPADPTNRKAYGSAVWNHWLDARYGPEVVRAAWERSRSTQPVSFAPAAYESAIDAAGGDGVFDEFTRFAVAAAEWQRFPSGFPDAGGWPDVQRSGTLAPDSGAASLTLDHTAFALFDVPRQSAASLRLVASFPPQVDAALALIGRTPSGQPGFAVEQLPNGGAGAVTLPRVQSYERITAVLVNAEVEEAGLAAGGDWRFPGDGAAVQAHVSTDALSPMVTRRDPRPGSRSVLRDADVRVSFSEPVTGAGAGHLQLVDAKGRVAPARVTYDASRRTAKLDPARTLRPRSSYTVRAGTGIVDAQGNPLIPASWSFKTGRYARLSVTMPRGQSNAFVRRRGLLLALQSHVRRKVAFRLAVLAPRGQVSRRRRTTVGRARGSVRGRKRAHVRVRLSNAARRALRRGRRLRLLIDLQTSVAGANTGRTRASVRLSPSRR